MPLTPGNVYQFLSTQLVQITGRAEVMIAIAALECILAGTFHWLIPERSLMTAPSTICAESFTD
jgi:hypothetical protein